MADSEPQPLPPLTTVAKPITLIPVGLKEAGLDSPTFRATAHHFGEQIDIVEKWLENYIKAAGRVANEVTSLEALINTYLSWATPPQALSEAILDHDYTLLALKRYNEGAKEFWMATIKWMKKVESTVVDPIRNFLQVDVANLKNARRNLEHQQRTFDGLISRYSSNSKTKEASSLREDAFQLHEARKAYLKASMDYSVLAPQIRNALDKLLVKIFSDRWKDMRNSRDALAASFGKWSGDMDRIRGWSKEMENNERVFKRELELARTQIENAAEVKVRPPRELDDYAVSTVPYIGSSAPGTKENEERPDRQGWLFQRTTSGRPARTVWIRRWFYVKHGIFGYLANNPRTGAVEESDKIGVLLCGVRPAFNEERRFCFEVKTKDSSIVLQAETQGDLTQWISTFEVAKRKALENPASTEAIAAGSKSIDPAFAVTPPVAPEFAAKNGEQEEAPTERSNTLGVEPAMVRSSTEVSGRKPVGGERDGESSRDHAARIISKLKSDKGPSSSQSGGIAGLIAASHHGLALGVGGSPPQLAPGNVVNNSTDFKAILGNYLPSSSLAPSTLANPPAPTNLSKTAVVVSGERGLGLGTSAMDGGMPSGLMANIWGSANWGFATRLERGDAKRPIERRRSVSQPPSPIIGMTPIELGSSEITTELSPLTHRKTISMGADPSQPVRSAVTLDDYPNYYPLTLKAQDVQFRMIFPDVSRDDKLVLVFRAAWTATDNHEFPGRLYITMNDIYFYSNHFGLVLVSSISLDTIHEITAAPGKDCDFLFVHLKPGVATDGATRVTIKTFLEPLKMLQRRLTYLLRNADAEEPASLEDVIRALLKLELGVALENPSMESWEDVNPDTPTDGMIRKDFDNRVPLRIDGTLYPNLSHTVSRNASKFRLPVQPVLYVPQGMSAPTIFKEFDVTAKALFHVLAGDKSAVFQMLNSENGAEHLIQSPWVQPEQGHHRREFRYQVVNGGKRFDVADHQLIDVLNDHLCYVITDRRTPWSLPSPHKFSLMTKIVITHAAKSRCRLSIYTRVDWRKDPLFGKGLIETQALADLKLYATSLTAILTDQVSKLGTQANNSRKAVQIFGQVGAQTQSSHVSTTDIAGSRSGDRIRTHTIVGLTSAALQRTALQVFFAILGLIVQFIQSTAKVITAHAVVVGLLALSAFTNVYFANRDTWSWWRERNARSFMAKIGVHPNVVMGRSVWLRDLDTFLLHPDRNQTEVGSLESPCVTQFNALVRQTDPSASPGVKTKSAQSPHTQSTIRRLQRSRQHIGSYRHDLLVALRTVTKIEKEIMKTEWESWVWSEATKCKHAVQIVQSNNETDGLREWWNEYCGSCLMEMERL
ncbi:hypothetical protein E6O75_ATG02857 [Venturia nashicola]|uniref:Transcription factor SipA3 n=1 Tax=Venturia nashicola TaxID=86259 RepID=A0A4Z1PPB7_9PEZI|nr:hypothetical protein E6O75_ATG02857 [Venturia nashicola]